MTSGCKLLVFWFACYFLQSFFSSTIHAKCLNDQRSYLLPFGKAVISDRDDFPKYTPLSWNESMDCCGWEGVVCDGVGHVISLSLEHKKINTSSANEDWKSIFKLQYLEALDLFGNSFGGIAIPVELFNLTRLKYLELFESDFTGQIPVGLSKLTSLVTLDLSSNPLEVKNRGGLEVLFQNLTQLQRLYLDYVDISGGGNAWSNAFSSLSKLQVLSLTGCQLSGPILPSLSNLTSLTTIQLDVNPLNTTIPDYFSNFTHLKFLGLVETGLLGQFPQKIFLMPTLEILDLSNNPLLGGSLPHQFPKTGSLIEMSLSGTNFSGSLPDSIGNLKALSFLDLSRSSFSGAIPSSLFALPSLQLLALSHNSFNGTLRLDMFNKFKNLTHLDISHNNLSIDASCSTCLSSFPQLQVLGLASCNMKMFPSLRNQSSMTYLDLSLNSITGKIPNWIWTISSSLRYLNLSCNLLVDLQKPHLLPNSLEVLDLHANLLKGEIPIPRPGGCLPRYVEYSNNSFTTSIPSNIGEYICNIEFFSLSHNNIQGDIPKSICKGTSLEVLDLSNNFLRGKIPKCLFGMVYANLGVLNLSGNKLGGYISNTFRHNCGLRTLDLSRNSLRGKIPTSLSNCKSLQVFNVGNNNLEDNFPCTLTKSLSVLVLRSNMFHSEINCSWGVHNWPSLQILDVSYNNFSGALPPQLFLNCRGMMIDNRIEAPPLQFGLSIFNENYQDRVKLVTKGSEVELVKIQKFYKSLDFTCNNFEGNIPNAIGELRALYSLNLSHNALTGIIPKSFGKLEQLESLDLSINQLTGRVPSELGDLTFLSFLNLSYNQLNGKIPDGRQLQTLSYSSFLGNKGLCGFPLNVSCHHGLHNSGSSVSGLSEKKGIEWEFVSAALGFSVGIGIILWMNILNPAWWQRFNSLIIQFIFLRVFCVDVLERSYRNPIRRV